jgi:predicted Rossmann fold nucleotide-binding protein DprA/Smf involved in DNA uptake
MIKHSANMSSKNWRPDSPSIVPGPALEPPAENEKRNSMYRQLLERLLDSPKNSVLRVRNAGARDAFNKEAGALGWKAIFAEHDGWLYVKIGGVMDNERPRPEATVSRAAQSVLDALGDVPMTASEVARILRSDSASCEAVLIRLAKAGVVERDDGLGRQSIYRVMSPAKEE